MQRELYCTLYNLIGTAIFHGLFVRYHTWMVCDLGSCSHNFATQCGSCCRFKTLVTLYHYRLFKIRKIAQHSCLFLVVSPCYHEFAGETFNWNMLISPFWFVTINSSVVNLPTLRSWIFTSNLHRILGSGWKWEPSPRNSSKSCTSVSGFAWVYVPLRVRTVTNHQRSHVFRMQSSHPTKCSQEFSKLPWKSFFTV